MRGKTRRGQLPPRKRPKNGPKRPKPKLRRKPAAGEVFGRELALLSEGVSHERVLDVLLPTREDQRHRLQLEATLAYVASRDGIERPEPIAQERKRARLVTLRLFLRICNALARKGGRIVAQGPAVYFGKQHELRQVLDESGAPDLVRVHVPAKEAGGLAARIGRSPTTLYRHARVLREGGMLASNAPPDDSPDAVLSHTQATRDRETDGRFSYAEWWVPGGLPPSMLHRLRLSWPGENVGARAAPLELEPDAPLSLDEFELEPIGPAPPVTGHS